MAQTLSRLQILLHADTANFRRDMQSARETLSGFGGVASKAMGAFAKTVAAGASAAAIAVGGIVQHQLTASQEIQKFSQLANISTDQFQRMSAGAKSYGIESEQLASTLKDVNDKVGDFLTTGGGEMADFFEKIAPKVGVTAEQFRGLSGADALQLYYSSLEKANLSQAEMVFYLESIADDATSLQPLLANGGAGFKQYGDAAAQAGAIMSKDTLAGASQVNAAMGTLKMQISGLSVQVFTAMLPSLQQLSQWIVTNKDSIQAFASAIGTGLSAIGSVIGSIVSSIGTFASMATNTFTSISNFVNQNKEAFIALGAAVAGAAVAFGAIQAGIAIFGIFASGTATITLLSGAFTALTAVIGGLGAVFAVLTSPITLTIAAIAALTAAGVYLYRNWDEVKAKATAIFNALPQPVQQMAANIKSIFTGLISFFTTVFNAVKPIAQAGFAFFVTAATVQFNILKSVVTTAWAVIKGLFTANLAAIKAVLTAGVSVFATVFNTGFNLVKNVVTTVFNVIKAVVNGDMQGVKNAISNVINNSISIVRNGASQIVGAFKTLGSQMMQIGADVINGLINGIKNRATALISYVQSLGSQVNATFRRVFDTHSPSKVTTEIGEFVGDGLIVGLQNRSDAVTNQAATMANSVIEQTDSVKKAIADLQAKPNELAKAYADIKNSHESGIKGIERQYQERANVISAANVDQAEKELVIQFEQKQMMEDLAHLYVQQSEEGSKYYEAMASYQDVALRKYDNERILIQNNARWTQKAKDYALAAIDEIQKRDIASYELSQQKKLDDLTSFNDTALEAIDKRYAYERIEVELIQGLTDEYRQQLLEAQALKQQYEREQVQKSAANDFNNLNAQMSGTQPYLELQNQLDAKLEIIKKAKDAEVITTEQAEQAKAKIERQYQLARYDMAMSQGQMILGSVTNSLKATLGEHNKAYRYMFAVEKGVNIARSIMAIHTGIAMAAANPFPMNLGAMVSVASATASIVADIMALKNPIGQAHDGIMSVPESGTWNLEKGERVLPEYTAKRLDKTLDDVSKGNTGGGVNIVFENHTNATIRQVPSQNGELRFAIQAEIDTYVPQQLSKTNSPISQALLQNTTATRRL